MNSLEILDKVDKLRKQKGFSVYRLTKEAGISHNTLNSWRKRQTMPSFAVLEAICDTLGVSISILLMDSSTAHSDLTSETKRMLELWYMLNRSQKITFINLLTTFLSEH